MLAVTAGITISKAIDEYREHLVEKGNKPRSIETTLYRLGCMFPGTATVASFRDDDGPKLYDTLRKASDEKTGELLHTPSSHRNILAESKTFIRWCVTKKYAKKNFLEHVQGFGKRRWGRDKAQLTMDEARKFRDVAYEWASRRREGAIAGLFALLHDLRSIEIVSIRVRDIDDGCTLLQIPDAKTPAGIRRLRIAKRLQPILRRLIQRKRGLEYLLGDGKKPRDRNWVRKSAHKICKAAKIPLVDAQGLRRTHATLATEAGATADMIETAMGHTSFEGVTMKSYIARGTVENVKQAKVIDLLDLDDRRGAHKSDATDDDGDSTADAH